MDFQLTTHVDGGDTVHTTRETFYTPDKLMDALHSHISNWNVLNPQATLRFELRKVPNDVPTVEVAVEDELNLGEMLS